MQLVVVKAVIRLMCARYALKQMVMLLSYRVAITLLVSNVLRGAHAALSADYLMKISLKYISNETHTLRIIENS